MNRSQRLTLFLIIAADNFTNTPDHDPPKALRAVCGMPGYHGNGLDASEARRRLGACETTGAQKRGND